MTPIDPLYAQQWYLARLGDLPRVWEEYSGAGVSVGIYDSGIDLTHPDLAANYDPSRHVTVGGQVLSGAVTGDEALNYHGTAVAGLIGAAANGTGTVGVAWGASLTGVNIFDPDSPAFTGAPGRAGLAEAFAQAASFDVVYTRLRDWSLAAQTGPGFRLAAETGRDGLGTVIVQPAGNEGVDINVNPTFRHTITVAGLTADNVAAQASSHGASILVSAPAGRRDIVTTDLQGEGGLSSGDTTAGFGGTSTAAALVAGVVTLMLDANPELGWRDVMDILAMSAVRAGAPDGSRQPSEDSAYVVNAARDWNGGGMHVSGDYGFGRVDALAAVRLAESYAIINAAAKTSANEVSVEVAPLAGPVTLLAAGRSTIRLTIAEDISVDQVELTLTLSHAAPRELEFWLVSPGGTAIRLLDDGQLTATGRVTLHLSAEGFRGEQSAGTWELRVMDNVAGNGGSITALDLELFGDAASANDTYVYTDEYAEMLRGAAFRRTLSDTDGGTDWFNAAAVTSDSTINLTAGEAMRIDGASLRIAAGTVIEHAIGGDGNDRITGNAVGNMLYGMRGNDTILGEGGADTLFGGAGDDQLFGGAGMDRLLGGLGADRLTGGASADVFVFTSAEESPFAAADLILDFRRGTDLLDFTAMDLIFLGEAAFTGAAGELRIGRKGRAATVEVDSDGDAIADMRVLLHGVLELEREDFLL